MIKSGDKDQSMDLAKQVSTGILQTLEEQFDTMGGDDEAQAASMDQAVSNITHCCLAVLAVLDQR